METAHASQFFVCEDGRTIEVARGELAAAKRTNACVAKHFGLTIKPEKIASNQQAAAPKEAAKVGPSAHIDIALPVRKPQRTKLRATAAKAPQVRDELSSKRVAEATSTSYRRVRVINARTPSGRWFQHTR